MKCFVYIASLAVLSCALLSWSAFGETQSTVSLTMPELFTGNQGSFNVSNVSGAVADASGTVTYTNAGVTSFLMSSASGRYSGHTGNTYFGITTGPFQIFRSFLTQNYFTVASSSTICPSATSYNWLNIRVRTKDAPRGAMNPNFAGYLAGGTSSYDPSLAHLMTLNTTFDLAGPTVNSTPAATYDKLSSACSEGTLKVQSTGTNMTLDQYGTYFFGDSSFLYISAEGNPLVTLGVPTQTLTTASMAALSTDVFAGLYTHYDSSTAQVQKNIYLYPDVNGTTYTIYNANSLTSPTNKSLYGTLTCTSKNSPSNGFCSGTIALNGVGGTGKAICMVSTATPESSIACIAQDPADNTVAISILAHVPAKAVLSVSVPTTAASVSPNGSTTITATLQNLTGSPITSLADPSSGTLKLSAPFSDSGAYAGTGGTCGSTLAGYASCTVTITYHPTAVGTSTQIFRVAYNDNYFGTVNATVPIVGTSGLTSVAITPASATAPAGTSVQYTATATYSDMSTQDVTSAAQWSVSSASTSSVNSTGTVSFTASGSTTVTATLVATSGSQTVTETGGPIQDLGQSGPSGFDGAVAGLNGPSYGRIQSGQFFASDTANNRILIYNSTPSANQQAPDLEEGQEDFNDHNVNSGLAAPTANTMSGPTGIDTDGTHLVVADSGNNRVLIWNTIPTDSAIAPDLVLGQPDFVSATASNGGVKGKTMSNPTGIAISNTGYLYVADTGNNRVLIWTTFPTSNQQSANLILGQTNTTAHTANNGGISGARLSGPKGLQWDGTNLLVADTSNNRVLIWTSAPSVNGQTANRVLGQPDMVSSTANNGGVAGTSISGPSDVESDGTHVFVADRTNNRILEWATFPSTNQQTADYVLGQASLTASTANSGGISASSLNTPNGVATDGTNLIVADASNNRVLLWTSIPLANQTSANIEMGQPNMLANAANNQGTPTAANLSLPQAVHGDSTHIYVADSANNRVLIWTSIPTTTDQSANIVLGQPDMSSITANNGGLSANTLSSPTAVFSDGTHLFVADYNNNRVLIWNTIPTSNNTSANVVLGQPDFVSSTANNATGGKNLQGPTGIYSDGTHLFVADYSNNRVLAWNSIPTVNQTSAAFVLGHSNTTNKTANQGGISGSRMKAPRSVHGDGTNLYVADSGNNRVLMWSPFPTSTGQSATYILGQPNDTSSTANNGGIGATTMSKPMGVSTDGTHLFVSDYTNNRVLEWTSVPSVTQQTANLVLGQTSFTASTANNGGVSASSLFSPSEIYADGSRLWTADLNNGRILVSSYNAVLTLSDGPTYDYGFVGLSTSVDKVFTITNSGAGKATSVAIGTPALSAPFGFKGGSFPGTGGTCSTTISGQVTCTIVVTANPTVDDEIFSDTVRVSYNDGSSTKYASVGVRAATIPRAVLTITDTPPYNFGTVVHNSGTASHSFTVSNASGVTASLMTEVALTAPYAFTGGNYPGTAGTCGTVLATGKTCTIAVTFTPTAVGTFPGTLTLDYDDHTATQSVSITLTGKGS